MQLQEYSESTRVKLIKNKTKNKKKNQHDDLTKLDLQIKE